MGLPELKQNLGKKILNRLYVFTGSEVGIMDVYLNKISEISNKEKRRENSIKDIYNLLSTKSLSNKNYTYIIRDDKEFLSKEKIWKTLEKVIGNNILIIVYTNLDKRSKFYKHFQSNIIEFDKLTTIQLNQYVLKELGLKNVHSEQ
jgi:DNA polymerase III delta subunit